MTASEWGKRLGIGVRVAGRIAQQRAQAGTAASPQNTIHTAAQRPAAPASPKRSGESQLGLQVREIGKNSGRISRAAGRGMGGFLRPFSRVGGILWLEVTGFFFGLFALYFAQDLWRTRLGYAAGPDHQRFLIAAAGTVLFGYFSASAFWRARRK